MTMVPSSYGAGYSIIDERHDRHDPTDAERLAAKRADEYPGDELNKDLGIDNIRREELIERHGFPRPLGARNVGRIFVTRQFIWSRAAVTAWKAEILALAAKLK